MIRVYSLVCLILCLATGSTSPVRAMPPSDQLLPRETKGFMSIPNVEDFRERWQSTQLGKLSADPVMRPFAEDLQRQVRDKFIKSRFNITLTWKELAELCGGEFSLASIQPENDPKQHAAVMIVDVQGRLDKANEIIDRIAGELSEKGAKKTTKTVAGHELTIHELPRQRGETESDLVVRFLVQETLVIGDHVATCEQLLDRLINLSPETSLNSVAGFKKVMQRVAMDAGDEQPQMRWYIDPFDYATVVRASQRGPRKRRKDMLAILKSQGFDAIRAIGGYVHVKTDDHEILHRTMIYAPAVEEAPEKYHLAARMLDFPNDSVWNWHDWIPRELAGAASFRWKIQEAFDHSETLVDAVAGGEGFFEDLLTSIKDDPNGPQIDVRDEFVRHLGNDVTVVSDHIFPITPQSERILVAIAVNDEEAVRQTVLKALESDPDARPVEVNGLTIWEIIDPEDDETIPDLNLELNGIDPIGDTPLINDEEDEAEKILRNSAVTVAFGHLMVASHVDCLRRIVDQRDPSDQLNGCEDFRLVNEQLQKIGAGEDSVRFFTRTDESYRPTYELIRQGKMPESESMFGKLLNRILGPEDEDVLREQKIDGSQLPDYQTVRRYLGPAGAFIRSEEDGWFASGLLLDKQSGYVEGIHRPAAITSDEGQQTDSTP